MATTSYVVNGTAGGLFKTLDNLSWIQVYGAGHEVPYYGMLHQFTPRNYADEFDKQLQHLRFRLLRRRCRSKLFSRLKSHKQEILGGASETGNHEIWGNYLF
jgi:hypothetical protein